MNLADPGFWIALTQVAGTNVVLSVDNAVVIAIALRTLAPASRLPTILIACSAVVLVRILLTAGAAILLELPYLRLAGALLLIWIGVKLLRDNSVDAPEKLELRSGLAGAIGAIVVADTVMSIDNVVAVAGAAAGSYSALAIGLIVSIPLIICGAALVARIIERYPLIAAAGGALIGWVAGGMVAAEPLVASYVETSIPWLTVALKFVGAGLVLLAGKGWPRGLDHRAKSQ